MPIELTGTIDINEVMKRLRKKQEEANQANLQRYEALMTHMEGLTQQIGKQGTYGAAMSLMEQTGEAARTRIAEQAKKATAAAEQDLISRGLGATTVRQAERRGIAGTAERARQEAEERTAAAKAGVLERRAGAEMQIGALKAGVMERREDVGPDLGIFASLIQAAAAGETATAKRTSTIIGPQAQAGRDIFGQPMGGGAGGAGGGLAPAGGPGGAGARPAGTYYPPAGGGGLDLGPTGAARGWDPQTGRATGLQLPGLAGAGAQGLDYGGTPGQAAAAAAGEPSFAGGEADMVSLSDLEVGPGGVPPEEAAEAAEPQRAERFETYQDYKAAMQRRGMRYPMGPTLWHALNRRSAKQPTAAAAAGTPYIQKQPTLSREAL